MRALGLTSGIGSMLIGARKAGFEVVGNVEWRKYYHCRDDQGRNTFTENFPGAFLVHSLDELEPEQIEELKGIDLVLSHPECLTNGNTRVYTSKGWARIKDVHMGDLVLTHKGRYRSVTRVFRNLPTGETEKIELCLATVSTKVRSLVVTGNHPVLMDDGSWKQAGEVHPGDRVVLLARTCPVCSSPIPWHPGTDSARCSHGCQVQSQWDSYSDKQRRNQVQNANDQTRKIVGQGQHPFQDPVVRRKGQQTIGERSPGEKILLDRLSEAGLDPEHQHPVGPYFVDVALVSAKIAVEVDGGTWHNIERKKSADDRKTQHLVDGGWIVLRFSGDQATRKPESCVQEIQRLVANHDGKYRFSSFEVKHVLRSELSPGTTLFNLGVEEDNSFVAKGFVVHNCGNFSGLTTRRSSLKKTDSVDLPVFIDGIRRLRPRFFVMDNLPASFEAVPPEQWAGRLPDYDLFPEWISNYHYGNSQKHRRRFFMIGALKTESFTFRPGELDNRTVLRDVIGDLPLDEDRKEFNHVHVRDDEILHEWFGFYVGMPETERVTLAQFKEYLKKHPIGISLPYTNRQGEEKRRIGRCKIGLDRPAPVVSGGGFSGGDNHFREDTLRPLTQRERARIQGCPDDFIFYPLDYRSRKDWNNAVYKQLGKFMPVQFCEYVSKQIAAHLKGEPFESSGQRLIKPNEHIDRAKRWYCENVGYGEIQDQVCKACWMKSCKIQKPTEPWSPPEVAPETAPDTPIEHAETPLERAEATVPVPKPGGSPGRPARPQRKSVRTVDRLEQVHLRPEAELPEDYVGASRYAEKYAGQLIRPDGTSYSRLDRNHYYDQPVEKKHPAKTPLHVARWAIQTYTEPGDWVLDPTMGAGTTAVEALNHGRNVVGIELEFMDVVRANIAKNLPSEGSELVWRMFTGDARNLETLLGTDPTMHELEFDLVVNNPPYSGDTREKRFGRWQGDPRERDVTYRKDLPNLAHLKENPEYWGLIDSIYGQCAARMKPGARFVVAVKDMIRNGQPYRLHEMLGDVLSKYLTYERMVLLRHHPTTLFLNTYEKKTGVKPPLYQTILVFRKESVDAEEQ